MPRSKSARQVCIGPMFFEMAPGCKPYEPPGEVPRVVSAVHRP